MKIRNENRNQTDPKWLLARHKGISFYLWCQWGWDMKFVQGTISDLLHLSL